MGPHTLLSTVHVARVSQDFVLVTEIDEGSYIKSVGWSEHCLAAGGDDGVCRLYRPHAGWVGVTRTTFFYMTTDCGSFVTSCRAAIPKYNLCVQGLTVVSMMLHDAGINREPQRVASRAHDRAQQPL